MDEMSDEQRVIIYLLAVNLQLRTERWEMYRKWRACAAETKALTAELKKLRKMVNQVFHDLGVVYQVFHDTLDNSEITYEQYQRIFRRIQRWVTPYVTWWRKQK